MAQKWWIGGGTNANWNASPSTNWAATSGDTVRVAAPGVGDDVFFDGAGATGNSASTVSAAISCLSLTFTSGYTNTVTINTTVILTVAGNFTDHVNHSWTVNGTGNMTISAASSITSGGKTFPGPVTFSGTNTKTLVGNWTIGGALVQNGTNTVLNRTTAETLTTGGLTMSAAMSGTATVILASGTWTGSSVIQNNLTFAGNVTISSGVNKNGGTVTYSSGTITVTGSTVTVAASTTWDTNGMSFNNITFSATGTQTINSLLTVNGTIQIANGAAMTFAGTVGFTCGTLNAVHSTAQNQTFKNGLTYTILTSFQSYLAPNSGGNVFISDDGTVKTNIVLLNASTLCNTNGRFTRVDASGGRPIITFNNTITNCINVFQQNNVLYKPVESFNRGGRRAELLNKNKAVMYQ